MNGPCSKENRRLGAEPGGDDRSRSHLTRDSSGATRPGAFDGSFSGDTMGTFKRTIGESLNGGSPVVQKRSRT